MRGHRGRHGLRGRSRAPLAAVCLLLTAVLAASCGGGVVLQDGGAASGGGTSGDGEGVWRNDYTFLVCGDTHARTDLLARIVSQARGGEFLVIVGDISTGKGLEEMRGMKDFLDGTGIPYYVIPGDNDMPRGDPSVFRSVFGPDYYSLDMQDSHLVFLNDAVIGVGCPPQELVWLREDLAGAAGKPIIAFAHVPPGAPVDMARSGFVEEESKNNREMKDLLAAAGTPVIYCGHIHAYMLYSSGAPRVVVTGGAGAKPHLSEESGGFHHFLRVTVSGNQVSEEVIPL